MADVQHDQCVVEPENIVENWKRYLSQQIQLTSQEECSLVQKYLNLAENCERWLARLKSHEKKPEGKDKELADALEESLKKWVDDLKNLWSILSEEETGRREKTQEWMRQPGGPDELHKLLLERVEELKYWKMWGVEQERNISSFKKALMMWPEIQWGPRPRTEVAREKFKCPYCDKTCQNVGWLKRHIRTRHSLKSESDVDAAADDPRLQCPYCGTAYGSVGWLKRHIQEKHARTPQLPYRDAGNVGVNCFLCDVTCGTADGLVRHVHARHSSGSGSSAKKVADALRLECPYCNKTYAISGWRKRHVQKRHAEKLQASYQDAVDDFLTCPVCPASRSTCGELWEHIRKEHRLGQWEEDMDSDMSL